MSIEHDQERRQLRVYMTGSCDGSENLRAALASHPELEFVGASDTVAEGAAALAGGHLQGPPARDAGGDAAAGRPGRDPRAHAGADHARRLR